MAPRLLGRVWLSDPSVPHLEDGDLLDRGVPVVLGVHHIVQQLVIVLVLSDEPIQHPRANARLHVGRIQRIVHIDFQHDRAVDMSLEHVLVVRHVRVRPKQLRVGVFQALNLAVLDAPELLDLALDFSELSLRVIILRLSSLFGFLKITKTPMGLSQRLLGRHDLLLDVRRDDECVALSFIPCNQVLALADVLVEVVLFSLQPLYFPDGLETVFFTFHEVLSHLLQLFLHSIQAALVPRFRLLCFVQLTLCFVHLVPNLVELAFQDVRLLFACIPFLASRLITAFCCRHAHQQLLPFSELYLLLEFLNALESAQLLFVILRLLLQVFQLVFQILEIFKLLG
mmetsp:Transcript_26315/g.62303  ORF Transcript_26315/g.62303 Transcript_26315/m.62303 type:complete len:341 (+) Transcript_26315:893-1915(+)